MLPRNSARVRVSVVGLAFVCLLGVRAPAAVAGPVAVRHAEGSAQTFLTLRSRLGQEIALGEFQQVPKGHTIQIQLVFRFRDGSVHDERAVFSQREVFRLERYQVHQHGPAFPTTLEASFRDDGSYAVKFRKKDKEEEIDNGHLDLPADVYNAMVTIVLKNLPKGGTETIHVVAFTPKPRVVKLELLPAGEDAFSVGHVQRKASHYIGKPDLGVLLGAVTKVVGKHPPDYHFWFLSGEAPAFVAAELPFYTDGPVWRVELTSPRWPKAKR